MAYNFLNYEKIIIPFDIHFYAQYLCSACPSLAKDLRGVATMNMHGKPFQQTAAGWPSSVFPIRTTAM